MSDIDEPLEQLLRHADPRPTPGMADAAAAQKAVHAEWRKVTTRRQAKKRLAGFAIAATVLLVVFSAFNTFRIAAPGPVEVAVIQKSFGSISFVGDRSILTPADALTRVLSGQTIVTGQDAGIALAWGDGGSLRIDRGTEIQFISNDHIYLHIGQVYFDSQPSSLAAGYNATDSSPLMIETRQGSVSHVGTQYMTSIKGRTLAVSVREGQVTVEDRRRRHSAASGQQLLFEGGRQPLRLSINAYGDAWDWVADTAPPFDFDGRTIDEFLQWVGRELGYDVVYSSDRIEHTARRDQLMGMERVSDSPAAALRAGMSLTGLKWRIDEGELHVGDSN
ncbi:MAG: FecR family protein [Gammaproteobacteria bacterium]|nr:FecR family protein [Gammaproteobacteria bacterium]